MKTISLELSKKLAPYLDGVKTEYNWCFDDSWEYFITNSNKIEWIKTLTLEEAIEFLPWYLYLPSLFKDKLFLLITKWDGYYIEYWDYIFKEWKTLLEAVEKMIEYLLDNNLLWKQ